MPAFKKPLPPAAYLKECFTYNPDTGVLTWLKRPDCHFLNTHRANVQNSKYAGKVAGSSNPNDRYTYVSVASTSFLAHRVIWVMVTGEHLEAGDEIDHINCDREDNRWVNLRKATSSQNSANTGHRYNNTTGYKGIAYYERNKKYGSRITHKGKKYFLGLFDDPKDAAEAYRKKAIELFGEFYRDK